MRVGPGRETRDEGSRGLGSRVPCRSGQRTASTGWCPGAGKPVRAGGPAARMSGGSPRWARRDQLPNMPSSLKGCLYE